MFLKASGTDVASSARWTSSLRGSPKVRTESMPSKSAPPSPRVRAKREKRGAKQQKRHNVQQSPYFYQQMIMSAPDGDSSVDETAWEQLRRTTEAQFQETSDMDPSFAPALPVLDYSCDGRGHDWVSTMDHLRCSRCGLQQAIDISQDVYPLGSGFVANGPG